MKLCECGCGQPAPIATMTYRSRGWIQGQPLRFILGHRFNLPMPMRKFPPFEERFWARVERRGPEECWPWLSTRTSNGYGSCRPLSGEDTKTTAHRVAYELTRGPIPEGMELDHLCRNRACVNPAHMEPVSHQQNCKRGVWARPRKTHCVNGHELSGDNIKWYLSRGKYWSRGCKACDRERARKAAA